MARPSAEKIITDNLDRIEEWAAKGLSVKEIAQNLGVSERTFYKYKNKNSEFKQTVKKGRDTAIENLENTMFKSALGFTQTVTKYEKVKHTIYDNGKKLEETEEMVAYEEEVYFKPDTTAAIFLLKNWANYMNEPQALKLREKEIELQEKKIELSEYS